MAGTPGGERIQVAIRARPTKNGDASSVSWRNSTLYIQADVCDSAASFRCDRFMDSGTTQDEAFTKSGVASFVQSALDGYACTVFAYGQTGAGKSFTIFGPDQAIVEPSDLPNSTQGILPRSIALLMHTIQANQATTSYSIRVGCVEIYNDQVYDLVATKAQYATNSTLSIRWSQDQGFFLDEATIVSCDSYEAIMGVILQAASNRVHSSHNLNERSNRSHCLVTIYIDSEDEASGRRFGKLTVVDLAGSERAHDTGAVGSQLKESGHINKSLYCLSQVILALNAGKKDKFVPYRDSKLTTLLIDSLGGNSRTLMLACVNASVGFSKETIRTLEFAMGVARIRNRPTAVMNPHDQLVSQLKRQIHQLKLENEALRTHTTFQGVADAAEPPVSSAADAARNAPTVDASATSGLLAPSPPPPTNKISTRVDESDHSHWIEDNNCAVDHGPGTRQKLRRKPHKPKTLPHSFDQGNPYDPRTPSNHSKYATPSSRVNDVDLRRRRSKQQHKLLPPLKSLSTPSLASKAKLALPSLTTFKSTPLLPLLLPANKGVGRKLLPDVDPRHSQSSHSLQDKPPPWEQLNDASDRVHLKPITPRDEWEDQRAHDLFLQLCNI